jgi:hypothetical protein
LEKQVVVPGPVSMIIGLFLWDFRMAQQWKNNFRAGNLKLKTNSNMRLVKYVILFSERIRSQELPESFVRGNYRNNNGLIREHIGRAASQLYIELALRLLFIF